MNSTTIVKPTEKIKKAEAYIKLDINLLHSIFAKYMATMQIKREHVRKILRSELTVQEAIRRLNYVLKCLETQSRLLSKENIQLEKLQDDEKHLAEIAEDYMNHFVNVGRIAKIMRNAVKQARVELRALPTLKGYVVSQMDEIKNKTLPSSRKARTIQEVRSAMNHYITAAKYEWTRSFEFISAVETNFHELTDNFI